MSAHEQSYQLETSRWSTGRNALFFAALVSRCRLRGGLFPEPGALLPDPM